MRALPPTHSGCKAMWPLQCECKVCSGRLSVSEVLSDTCTLMHSFVCLFGAAVGISRLGHCQHADVALPGLAFKASCLLYMTDGHWTVQYDDTEPQRCCCLRVTLYSGLLGMYCYKMWTCVCVCPHG